MKQKRFHMHIYALRQKYSPKAALCNSNYLTDLYPSAPESVSEASVTSSLK